MGARTIKVENPIHGDLARSLGVSPHLRVQKMGTGFLAQNAGKQSLAVNLKSAKGREIFYRLVSRSDVVLENFRPGVMKRLGLDYKSLSSHKPDLVYCAISGYGQDGPDAKKPAYDQIIQGKSGLMDVTGTNESGPLRCGIPIADTVGGLQAALAILAALYHRKNTGQGHFIDLSLLDAIMPMMGWVASNYFSTGIEPERMGNNNATAAPSGVFETNSGLLNIAANTETQWQKLCQILNITDLLEDSRFNNREIRIKNRAALTAILELRLKEKSAEQWEQIFNAQGIPCGKVLSFNDAFNQPQVKARNITVALTSRALGVLRVFGLAAKYDDTSQRVPTDLSPPPFLGEHTREILMELNYSTDQIEQMVCNGIVFCGT
jgi:formyl-CoA transferase